MTIGSESEDRARVAQLRGAAPSAGFLLRSPSSLAADSAGGDRAAAPYVALVPPELTAAWNSAIPFSVNDGALWTGRGWSTQLLAGFRASYGPLRLVVAPQLVYAQNGDFDFVSRREEPYGGYLPPWRTGERSVDLPLRFGDETLAYVDPGQSTLALAAGPVWVGVSTENQWWGPGVRNALVMSNNAPGFPHAFVRTSSPLRNRAGAFEGRWIAGLLRESAYFDADDSNDTRYVSGLALTFQPAFDPGLTVGLARTVYGTSDGAASALAHGADVLARWNGTREPTPGESGHAQITSLFARWIVAPIGAEVYGELARNELPTSLRDLLVEPNHTQGYTVGLQWVGAEHGRAALRFQAEATNVEQSATYRRRAVQTYYTSRVVPQGYTNRGQVVGAAIGPGASSQWLAADYLAGTWRLGVSGGRIRWDNDAYYGRPAAWGWLGHDVSLFGGIRGSFSTSLLAVQVELSSEKRYNYLFQNFGYSWETADNAVDHRNNMLRVTLVPTARPRPSPPPLRLPPPAPVKLHEPIIAPPMQPARPDTAVQAPAGGTPDTTAVPDSAVATQPVAGARPSTPADSGSSGGPRTHTVRPGETFSSIAGAHGVTLEALQSANPGVDPGRIRPAQVLLLPALSSPPRAPATRHRVSPGESLEGIAKNGTGCRRTRSAAPIGCATTGSTPARSW